MQFPYTTVATTTILSFAFLSIPAVLAQSAIETLADQIPSCAYTCLVAGATAAGCSSTDYVCICGKKSSLASGSTPQCIIGGCSTADALDAQKIGAAICTLVASMNVTSTTTAIISSSTSTGGSVVYSPTSSLFSTPTSSINSTITTSSTSTSATSTTSTKSSATATTSNSAASRFESIGAIAGLVILVAFAL